MGQGLRYHCGLLVGLIIKQSCFEHSYVGLFILRWYFKHATATTNTCTEIQPESLTKKKDVAHFTLRVLESLKSRAFFFFQTSYKSLFFVFPEFADALIMNKDQKKKKVRKIDLHGLCEHF